MTSLTQEQIDWLDKCTKGSWTLNPKTGLVNVKGNFICPHQGLKGFKGVKFGRVGGDFCCSYNQLTSLEGAPLKVGGTFYCDHNQLTSLVGAPLKVGGDFNCDHNQLTTLVGAPKKTGWHFSCDDNRLTSLVGAPQEVGGFFYCVNNRLTSLEGAPIFFGDPTRLVGRLSSHFFCGANPVAKKTLLAIFEKMCKGHSFVIAAASLRNEMSKTSWKLIAPHIPEAIRPGVSMLGRFGVI